MNIVEVFRRAVGLVKVLPEPLGRGIFRAIGTVAGWSNMSGSVQVRKNYQRLVPLPSMLAQRRRSAKALRSYMDYYYEAFRLPALTPQQIGARVRLQNDEGLREHFAQGKSASGALLHMGNWDLAGAWATDHLAPTFSIAEKLEPPELSDLFLNFRRSLGLTIYQTGKGAGAISSLTRDMQDGVAFVPLLCDRDLSASGVEVNLAGHPVRVAVGAALLAQRTGEPMYPATIINQRIADDDRAKRAGTRNGIVCIIGDPIYPNVSRDAEARVREADIIRMNQEWLDQVEPILTEHLTDWHMLQKVFVEDLDPERLARARRTTPKEEL